MILINHGKLELSDGLFSFYSPRTTSSSSVFRLLVHTDSTSVLAQADLISPSKPWFMPIGFNSN